MKSSNTILKLTLALKTRQTEDKHKLIQRVLLVHELF